jgi:hypothetical protein
MGFIKLNNLTVNEISLVRSICKDSFYEFVKEYSIGILNTYVMNFKNYRNVFLDQKRRNMILL